jgi:hypothetical protein
MIEMLSRYVDGKLLAPWKHGEELDDVVFRIAATFSMQYLEHKSYQMPGDLLHPFDPNAFIQRLIEETGISHTWKPVDIRAAEGRRCFLMADVLQSQDPKKNIDPEITSKHRTRQLLWMIWERCSGRSDLKAHPEALAGDFADYLIENLDLVREVEASFKNGSPPFPSMEVAATTGGESRSQVDSRPIQFS